MQTISWSTRPHARSISGPFTRAGAPSSTRSSGRFNLASGRLDRLARSAASIRQYVVRDRHVRPSSPDDGKGTSDEGLRHGLRSRPRSRDHDVPHGRLAVAMPRMVEPELLDALQPEDSLAVGSRRDLRRINTWMRQSVIMARLLGGYGCVAPPHDPRTRRGRRHLHAGRREAHRPGMVRCDGADGGSSRPRDGQRRKGRSPTSAGRSRDLSPMSSTPRATAFAILPTP